MMQESDSRVTDLQSFAWSLQSLSTKPGCKLSEKSKRNSYSLSSKALALCSDAEYTAEEDFVKQAAEFRKQIEAKKVELGKEEAATLKEREGKCYRAGGGGTYTVGYREDASPPAPELESEMLSSAAVAPNGVTRDALTAEQVVSWCAEEPLTLRLAGKDLKDSDMDAFCRGLQAGGAELTALDLSNNAIADTGVQRLVTALASKVCPKLTDLWLHGNCFGPLGKQMLQGGLGALRRGLVVHLESADCEQLLSDAVAEATDRRVDAREIASTSASDPSIVADGDGATGMTGVVGVGGSSLDTTLWARTEAPSGGGSLLQATIPLPDHVVTIEDVDSQVSEDRLVVCAIQGGSILEVEFPTPIDPDSIKAVFMKRKRQLKLTMHLKGI